MRETGGRAAVIAEGSSGFPAAVVVSAKNVGLRGRAGQQDGSKHN